MKIKCSSWHYRLMEMLDINQSQSLCVYFWQLVLWAPIKILFVVVMVLFMVGMFSIVLVASTAPIFFPIFYGEYLHVGADEIEGWVGFFKSLFMAGCMIWLFGAIFGVLKTLQLTIRWVSNKPVKASQPTLIGEYVRAKKEKVCPRIYFE